MPHDALQDWFHSNQVALAAEIDEVRTLLLRHAGLPVESEPAAPQPHIFSTLDLATERLHLSTFERRIVVMCAAVELEAGFAALCARAHGDAARAHPTFGLALAAFDGAHWSALTPAHPLRRFGLIDVERGVPLTTATLRIDEVFLHHLAGVGQLDGRLASVLAPLSRPKQLVPSQQQIAAQVSAILRLAGPGHAPHRVQLVGHDVHAKREIASEAFGQLNHFTYGVTTASLLARPDELEVWARIWEREALLRSAGLYIDAHDLAEPLGVELLARCLDHCATPAIIAARLPMKLGGRLTQVFEVPRPTRQEQRQLWLSALEVTAGEAPAQDEDQVSRVNAQFDFDAVTIVATVQRARAEPEGSLDERLWRTARGMHHNELSEIAQRLEDRPGWKDLILAPDQERTLRDIVAYARNRSTVHDAWGMAERHERGLGLGVLFYGPSGTGKTLAAEVIGGEMDLDVYRVDLSQLVSKYIGETEKNLRRIFDAAEGGGTILLFDECDAIFGKRGEVEHGQDRYANLEVSYLLQRMEAYRGIAILTTNMRSAIDAAFMRRLRFVVSFPHPDVKQRVDIWHRALGPRVPLGEIDFGRLARLTVTGASIRNIAMHAAFLAAEGKRSVTMADLRRAALAECAKLERMPSDVEIGGWA
ncbi:MAG TPA: ATP-binding protein [Rhodopila sp.]